MIFAGEMTIYRIVLGNVCFSEKILEHCNFVTNYSLLFSFILENWIIFASSKVILEFFLCYLLYILIFRWWGCFFVWIRISASRLFRVQSMIRFSWRFFLKRAKLEVGRSNRSPVITQLHGWSFRGKPEELEAFELEFWSGNKRDRVGVCLRLRAACQLALIH